MKVLAGIDLGGTHFRVGVRAVGTEMLLGQESLPASGDWTAEDIACQFEAALELLEQRNSDVRWQVEALGCGLTGDIDYRDGVCYSMKRFPRLEACPLAAILRDRLGVPVRILNDGLTAALAELRVGAGRDVQDFVMVTLGTGIGGGVVLDGRLLAGARGRVGKVGHQVVDIDGPVHCHCGLPGCWQTFAGKEGVMARARAEALANAESELARLVAVRGEPDLEQVAALAAQGDTTARRVVEETGRYVGVGLANLVKLFAPQRLIVGGGIAERNEILLAAAQRTVDAYAIKPYQHVPVAPAVLGRDAGVLGATYVAEGWADGQQA